MPWVDKDGCIGCGICVEKCPTQAMKMVGAKAEIAMEECIRCGICHKSCPQGVIKHDSLKIPGQVKDNVEKTKSFMAACVEYLRNKEEAYKCLCRMIKYFNKEKVVMEKTLEELAGIKKDLENR